MAISLKHLFQSSKGDGADPTQVQPSNWNEEHVITLASMKLIGRTTVGSGAAEEIPFTTYGASILNAADAAALKTILGKIALADMADMATDRILGRDTAGTGAPEALTLSQILDFIGSATQGDLLVRGSSTWERLVAVASGQVLTSQGVGQKPVFAAPFALLHAREEQSAGVGSSTAFPGGNNQWATRVINQVKTNEISGASRSGNQIILPAGSYELDASASYRATGSTQAKLRFRNITDTTTVVTGLNSGLINTGGAVGGSMQRVFGRFTIAGTKNFELQHAMNGTTGGQAFGDAQNAAETEVYCDIVIRKTA